MLKEGIQYTGSSDPDSAIYANICLSFTQIFHKYISTTFLKRTVYTMKSILTKSPKYNFGVFQNIFKVFINKFNDSANSGVRKKIF